MEMSPPPLPPRATSASPTSPSSANGHTGKSSGTATSQPPPLPPRLIRPHDLSENGSQVPSHPNNEQAALIASSIDSIHVANLHPTSVSSNTASTAEGVLPQPILVTTLHSTQPPAETVIKSAPYTTTMSGTGESLKPTFSLRSTSTFSDLSGHSPLTPIDSATSDYFGMMSHSGELLPGNEMGDEDLPTPPTAADDNDDDGMDDAEELLEDVEIHEFLRRASKQLQEVNIQESSLTKLVRPLPLLRDFQVVKDPSRPEVKQTDWPNFAHEYLLAQLDRNLPPCMLCPESVESFSLSRFRVALERIYVLAPPELWESIFEGKLGKIYKWTDPKLSTRYLAVYSFLWLFDLIPAFLAGFILFKLLDRHLNPPPPAELREEAKRRQKTGKQAEDLSREMSASAATQGALSALARGLGHNAGMIVLPGVGVTIHDSLMGTKDTAQPHGESASTDDPNVAIKAFPKSAPKGLYSLSRGLMSRYGPRAQKHLGDVADLGEKAKNLYLWRSPAASWRTVFLLFLIFVYLLITPPKWLLKNFFAWLGFEYFGVWWFTTLHPQYRKALNPLFWLLYGIPTDAEYVIQVLQERGKRNPSNKSGKFNKSHNKRPSRPGLGATMSSRFKRDHTRNESKESLLSLDYSVPDSDTASDAGTSIATAHGWKKWKEKLVDGGGEVYRRVKQSEAMPQVIQTKSRSVTNVELQDEASSPPEPSYLSRSFALLGGKSPGTLTLTHTDIVFEAVKGFRGVTTSAVKDIHQPVRSDATDAATSSGTPGQVKFALADLVNVKKIKSFGLGVLGGEGLELRLRHSEQPLRFSNVVNRDEFFNSLVGASAAVNKT